MKKAKRSDCSNGFSRGPKILKLDKPKMTRWTPEIVKMAKKKMLDLSSLLVSNRETETSKSNTPPTKKDRIDKAGHMPKSKPKIYFMTLHKKNYWQLGFFLLIQKDHPGMFKHGCCIANFFRIKCLFSY